MTGLHLTAGAPQTAISLPWTPTDGSGATLVFTSVNMKYTQVGNMVYVYGTLTYPTTLNSNPAVISGLPVNFPNQNYTTDLPFTNIFSSSATAGLVLLTGISTVNTSTFQIKSNLAGGASILNSQLSALQLFINGNYPAT